MSVTYNYNECFDVAALRYIVANFETFGLKSEIQVGAKSVSQLQVLRAYLHKVNKSGFVKVTYQQSKHNTGRFFAKGGLSLQSFQRGIRHTIAEKYYIDIDMVNAHPCLLMQYCQKNNIPCQNLEDYVTNREDRLAALMKDTDWTRDECKASILSLTNGGGGSVGGADPSSPWILNYKNEMVATHHAIANREPEFKAMVEGKGKKFNILGSVTNYLLCELENKMLQAIVKYAQSVKAIVNNACLVFDGVMLYRKDFEKCGLTVEAFLRGAEKYVKETTGYEISLIEKPMKEVLELPADLTVTSATNSEIVIEDDENEAADKFYEIIKNDIRKCQGVIYIRRGGVWCDDREEVKDYLVDKCMRANFVRVNADGVKKNYSSKLSCAEGIVRAMLTRVPSSPNFVTNMKRSTHKKLVWANGVYDFETKTFTPGFEGVDSMIQITREFPKRNKELMDEIYRLVIDPILGETGDLATTFLKFVARAMSGHFVDKKFGVMMGERDCGKGAIGALCRTAFEKYIGTITAESLLVTRVGHGDEAKKLSWTMEMEHTRLAITNEIKFNEEEKLKLDGNMLKKIASGGDVIQARKNFKDERNFQIGATLLMCCNDLPKISPADAYEKMVPFMCPHKFVEDLTEEEAKKEPFKRKAESYVKDVFCAREDVGDAFFWIIADHYLPRPVRLTEKMVEYVKSFNSSDETDTVLAHFEVTKNPEDRVSSKEVDLFIQKKKLNISAVKFKHMMETRGAVYKRYREADTQKVIRGFVGLRYKEDEDQEETLE